MVIRVKLEEKQMDEQEKFKQEKDLNIKELSRKKYREIGVQFVTNTAQAKYSYNFCWMGRPIIQFPQDMVAVQELIWEIKPDLIIETGIAHGGSLIMNASMLAMLDYSDSVEKGEVLDPKSSRRKVLGIDIDIRKYNREAIEAHSMSHMIHMIEGSSIDSDIIKEVHDFAGNFKKILVILDSNHTHDHVLAELEAYAMLTSQESYCIVFDTIVEDMDEDSFPNRPWRKGNNPKTAVWKYLELLKKEGRSAKDIKPLNFEIDNMIENKLLITVAPDGYLKRIK
jgi:cephalosporin hydroxylase